MNCRRNKLDDNHLNVVWFGSYGRNEDGTAKFFNEANKHDNFSEAQQSVIDSLTQQLSVLQGELWYAIDFGLPVLDNPSKLELDAEVADIVLSHPDVVAITKFSSTKTLRNYDATITIESVFGELVLNI